MKPLPDNLISIDRRRQPDEPIVTDNVIPDQIWRAFLDHEPLLSDAEATAIDSAFDVQARECRLPDRTVAEMIRLWQVIVRRAAIRRRS